MEETTNSIEEYLLHIANVMYERVTLYEKRFREIRRSVKAMSRLEEIPEVKATFLLLEAEIQYVLNFAGYQAVKSVISNSDFSNRKYNFDFLVNLESNEDFKEIFYNKIMLGDNIIKEINATKSDTLGLLEVILNLDEDYQRNIIGKFILVYIEPLVTKVFKEIVILDNNYTNEVIKNFKENPIF